LSTQATDKDSTSSKENLITTPKKNKLASSSLGTTNTSSEPQFKKQITKPNDNSATKKVIGRGKKGDDKEDEKEENITSHNLMVYSKQENNYHLSNKKAIFYNMKVYYEALGIEYHQHMPITFHIKEGLNDPSYHKFEQLYREALDPNSKTILDQHPKFGNSLWIVKPGENTNRGCGIQVSKELDHIKSLVSHTNVNGNRRSYIIQKYIERPLLYKGRKFDIRTFTMMCTINGNLQGYWYSEGYLRTSSKEFTLKNVSNRFVHLTNDAVQKKLDDYGKYESGNKLSYPDFQKFLDAQKIKCDIDKDLVPKLKNLARDSMRAVRRKVDPVRKAFSFEIYGYDFMLDEACNPYIIEVNTNPCFELSSPFLARLIPQMIENALK
jgi:tubulin polyglutamylase TTLL1